MGAWDTGNFDNDDAGDWAVELEDAGTIGPVLMAFDEVDASGDYLDAGIACMALAAAETVAALLGKPIADLPEPVAEVVADIGGPPDGDLVARARLAVEKVAAESELRELWEETDNFDEWQSIVADLLVRLG